MKAANEDRSIRRPDPAELARLSLMEGADLDQVAKALSGCRIVHKSDGEVILRPERRDGHVYGVLEGQLSVHLGSPDGTAVARIVSGDCVGELSFVDKQRPSAYVSVVGEAKLLVISERAMWRLLETSHAVALNLLSVLAGRVRADNEMISSATERGDRLEQEAMLDGLTGILNRRGLEASFPEVLRACHGRGQPACLVMADVDHFKTYNDTWGHAAGDAVLKDVARGLEKRLRDDDLLARYGGEEFALLLPGLAPAEALSLCRRLGRGIARRRPRGPDEEKLPSVTLSFGIAACTPGRPLDEALVTADKALYEAKEAGRNRAILGS